MTTEEQPKGLKKRRQRLTTYMCRSEQLAATNKVAKPLECEEKLSCTIERATQVKGKTAENLTVAECILNLSWPIVTALLYDSKLTN